MDQVVGVLGPVAADQLVAEVVAHPARARREQREIGAALALHLELTIFDAFADLIIGDVHLALARGAHLGDLGPTVRLHAGRVGRVVPVDINDHGKMLPILATPSRRVSGSYGRGVAATLARAPARSPAKRLRSRLPRARRSAARTTA